MIYQFRLGYSLPGVTAQVVGDTLQSLEKKHGKVTPAGLIFEAHPANHPLHNNFEWNNEKAGDQWRLNQARQIIRSVEVVTILENGQQQRELGYVSVAENKAGGAAYINTRAAMADERFSAKVLHDAEAQLIGWRRRYGDLTEVQSKYGKAIKEIDNVLQESTTEENSDGESENPAPTNKRKPARKPSQPVAANAVG